MFAVSTFSGGAVLIDGLTVGDVQSGLAGLSQDESCLLRDMGILDPEQSQTVETVYGRYRAAQRSSAKLDLTITPTMGCNYSCYYCFEKKTPDFLDRLNMDDRTIEQLVRYVDQNMAGRSFLNVFWFGGEPTLEQETMGVLSRKFMDICGRMDAEYSATLITNGSLINDGTIEYLKDLSIDRVQLTIDGNRERHNKTRNDGTDRSSYDHLVRLSRYSDTIRISYRINITEPDIDKYYEVIEDISRFDPTRGAGIYFAPIMEYYSGAEDRIRSTSHRFRSVEDFARFEALLLERLHDMGYPFDRGKFLPRALPCSAVHWGSVIVGPQGKLFKCDHELGVASSSFGDIWNGAEKVEHAIRWMNRGPWQNMGCRDCELLPSCMGHCADYHDLGKERSEACPSFKYNQGTQLRLLADSLTVSHRTVGRIAVVREASEDFRLLDASLDRQKDYMM